MTEIKYFPEKEVDGLVGWNWIVTDSGAWDGPKEDWLNYHKDSIIKHVDNFRTVIQCGGNQGMYPKLLARMFNVVYTFEPDADNFRALNLNCIENNIFKFEAALGHENKLIGLFRRTMENTGMHTINDDCENIVMLTLDSIPVKDVDLIFLDVEGYELNVLKGAEKIIMRDKPAIICERPSKELGDFLTRLGYYTASQTGRDLLYKSYT